MIYLWYCKPPVQLVAPGMCVCCIMWQALGGDDICVTKARSTQDMHVSYQQPTLTSAFTVHLSECDVGVCRSPLRVSKFTNTQLFGCM